MFKLKIFKYLPLILAGLILTLVISTYSNELRVFIYDYRIGFLIISGILGLIYFVLQSPFMTTFFNNISEHSDNWQQQAGKKLAESLWLRFTTPFQSQYYQSLTYAYRDFKTEGLKVGLPVLDLAKVFVPQKVATETPNKISNAIIDEEESFPKKQKNSSSESQEIWDFLAEINQTYQYRRIALIAPPGAGKSTLLEHLALSYATNAHQEYNSKAPRLIPILFPLRNIYNQIITEREPNLAELVTNEVKKIPPDKKLNPPEYWFEEKLKGGECLVMLDGLDEVADIIKREKVSKWINKQMLQYPETPFIVTSRPLGYISTPIEEIGIVLEVQPFTLQQIEKFTENWYLQTEIKRRAGKDDPGVRDKAKNRAESLIKDIKENEPIAAMATNPLLLSMITSLHYNSQHALPQRRVELYSSVCKLVLGERQRSKRIPDNLSPEQKKSVLQVLALELMKRQTQQFTLLTGSKIIQEQLASVAGIKFKSEIFLKEVAQFTGFLVEETSGRYKFAHSSFQEYLAASQVKELNEESLLIDNFFDDNWSETIRLYAAQSDATNLIIEAIKKPSVKGLKLAYYCLEECLSVQPEVREKLEEILVGNLESENEALRKLASDVLLARRLK
jgi:predicted NACHT family NTPase